MTTKQFILTLLCFVGPIACQRGHYACKPVHFLQYSRLRRLTGKNIHHAHWGLVWMAVGIFWMSFGEKNTWNIGLTFLGLGLLADEIIPSIDSPAPPRELELQIYARSKPATLYLAASIVSLMIILFVISGK